MNHIGGSMGQAVLYTILFLLMLFSTSCESKKNRKMKPFRLLLMTLHRLGTNMIPKRWQIFGQTMAICSPLGESLSRQTGIENHFSEEHTNGMKDSHINLTIQNIRFIDSNTAFVDADITISDMKVAGERASLITIMRLFCC